MIGVVHAPTQPTQSTPSTTKTSAKPAPATRASGYTWHWSTVAGGGYTFSGRLSIGSPTRVASATELSGFGNSASAVAHSLHSACDSFDSQTDAVIPTTMTMRNDTKNFSADVYMVVFADPDNVTPIYVATSYKSGVECHVVSSADDAYFNGGDGWDVDFPHVAPNASAGTAYSYLIFRNYYSPDAPNGNSYDLDHSVLDLASSFYLKDGQQITKFNGPGYDQGDNKRLGLMPLDGRQVACDGLRC